MKKKKEDLTVEPTMEIRFKSTKEKKKKKDLGPTPELGIPKPEKQIFSEHENKLLDQITLEITTAWAKDLKNIRSCYEETLEINKLIHSTGELLYTKLSRLSDFLNDDDEYINIEKVLHNQNEMFNYMNEIRKEVLDISNKTNLPDWQKLKKEVDSIFMTVHSIQTQLRNEKKWWQFWK